MLKARERTQRWTFAILSRSIFMVILDNLVVITALPAIRQAFGASVSDLERIANAYTRSFAVSMMTGAALGDPFGRKRFFIVGFGIFIAASLFAALGANAAQLKLARAVQGVGAAFVTLLSLSILIRLFAAQQGALAIGLRHRTEGRHPRAHPGDPRCREGSAERETPHAVEVDHAKSGMTFNFDLREADVGRIAG